MVNVVVMWLCIVSVVPVYAGNQCCVSIENKKGDSIVNSKPNTKVQRARNEDLFTAVCNGETDKVKSLLKAKANIDCRSVGKKGSSVVLIDCALIRGNVALAILLREEGAPLPAWDMLQKYRTSHADNEEMQKFFARYVGVEDEESRRKQTDS